MTKRDKKLEIINRCINNCTTWVSAIGNLISEEKVYNACRSYAGNVNPKDVIALIDETIFGNGKKGMLFTENGLYYSSSMGGQYFSYSEPKYFERRGGYNCVALNEMIQELNNIEIAPSGVEILGGIIGKAINFISELNEIANEDTKDNDIKGMIGNKTDKGINTLDSNVEKDDKKNGNGTYTFPDGKRYEGEFKDGKFHGHGILTFPNGKRYEGEFKNGYYSNGTYTFPEGNKYEGEWKNGKYHGNGTYTYRDGRKKEGKWEDGKYLVQ